MPMNDLGQPIGDALPGWTPPPVPPRAPMDGRHCRLEPLAPHHADALHDAFAEDGEGRIWTYLPNGPYASAADFRSWVAQAAQSPDPMFFAILVGDRPVGHASYLRITPASGSIEVGFINYAPALQRTRAATEVMALMMEQAFGLGYRRYEWKCDALNAPSRAAAERLGFTFEGIHRQATVYKARNRDTAWYSILDREWPAVRAGFEAWLDPANFDAAGQQRRSLAACRTAIGVDDGPAESHRVS